MTDELFEELLKSLREGAEMLKCCGTSGHVTYVCRGCGVARVRCMRCGATLWLPKEEDDGKQ